MTYSSAPSVFSRLILSSCCSTSFLYVSSSFANLQNDKNRKGGGSYLQAVTPVLFHQTKNLNPRPPRHGEATIKKTAGCDGHLSQTRPSILILPNESPTEGTWWDHLPQDGKIHTSITSSQHITPPHCCCFTQHWHPRGHQLWITCENAIYPIIGMKHTIISLKESSKVPLPILLLSWNRIMILTIKYYHNEAAFYWQQTCTVTVNWGGIPRTHWDPFPVFKIRFLPF